MVDSSWYIICDRICEEKCLQTIPSDILCELVSEQESGGGVDYVQALGEWLGSSINYEALTTLSEQSQERVLRLSLGEGLTATAVEGPLLYSGGYILNVITTNV